MNNFSCAQLAMLNELYRRGVNQIPGSWLIDSSVSPDKLDIAALYALLDLRYAPLGLQGTHRFVLRDYDDDQLYLWTFQNSTLLSKELVT